MIDNKSIKLTGLGVTGITAVSFDGDGTLWDFEKVMRHSLRHVLRELERIDAGIASRLTIERMIAIRNETAEEMRGITVNLEAIRLEAFRRTLRETGFPDDELARHCNEVYLKHRFEDLELFDDVLPVLLKLKAKYRLALISNGNSYPERIGLDGMFSSVIFSQDTESRNPTRRYSESPCMI